MSAPVYIFAGGGTGGHLFPALAVAEALTTLQPEASIVFACSDREIDRRILSSGPYAFVPQPIRPVPRSPGGWVGFLVAMARSRRTARVMVHDLRPAAVFGLGGFAAVAVVRAAARKRVRVGLMSIDAIPGLANRHLARRADAIFAQFDGTAREYGRWGGRVRVVGCPVRRALRAGDAGGARQAFGLRDDRRTLLVMSGSLGAANINDALAALAGDFDALAGEWQVLHVAGPGKAPAAGAGGRMHRAVLEFCDRMDLAYAVADLVLCRAGAATIGELTAVGVPAVLMPYPYHRDQHQRHNAAEMVARGSGEVVEDARETSLNAEGLRRTLLGLMHDPDRLAGMRSAAGGAARTDAAETIARWLAG